MDTFLFSVLIVLLVILAASAALTLAALPGWIRIPQPYLKKLFTMVILEAVAVILAFASKGADRLLHLSANVLDTARQLDDFRISLEDSLTMTQSWINEPSDITASGLTGLEEPKGPLALAVDDEEPNLYVIEPVMNSLRVRRCLRFIDPNASGPTKELDPEDLEAITWDGTKWYYASTSFRQYGKDGITSRYLLRFQIDPRRWTESDYRIKPDLRDISDILREFLADNGVEIDRESWMRRAEPCENWQPWALEIEGLATRDNLLIGLKWPLDSNKNALIAVYDWETNRFVKLLRLQLYADGISALSYDITTEKLIVVGNPPAKERTGDANDALRLLGDSRMYAFDWPKGSNEPTNMKKIPLSRTNAKLEGIALVKEEGTRKAWLAYDGPSSALIRQDIAVLDM